jgi:hypothetical protein
LWGYSFILVKKENIDTSRPKTTQKPWQSDQSIISPRSLTPKVNQMITMPRMILTRVGIVKPTLCFKIAFIGGKKIEESSMKKAPGTGCTNNRFDVPIAKTTRPNSQLMIFAVMRLFLKFYDVLLNTLLKADCQL